mmetsp:Transcript_32744/g.84930  ORF Transcript_32744/g.84930 Transcript_32744/m.84930 type:complete len:200 (-) Transcript_32744:515-1114(-)
MTAETTTQQRIPHGKMRWSSATIREATRLRVGGLHPGQLSAQSSSPLLELRPVPGAVSCDAASSKSSLSPQQSEGGASCEGVSSSSELSLSGSSSPTRAASTGSSDPSDIASAPVGKENPGILLTLKGLRPKNSEGSSKCRSGGAVELGGGGGSTGCGVESRRANCSHGLESSSDPEPCLSPIMRALAIRDPRLSPTGP